MNLQKSALIFTLSLVGLTSINSVGLKPAFADPAPAPQHQASNWNHQNPGNSKDTHARNGQENKLNLTEAQKAQFQQIEKASREQINAVYTPQQREELSQAMKQHQKVDLNLTTEQKNQIAAIRQETERKIQGILTADQQKQLAQHSSEGDRHQRPSN